MSRTMLAFLALVSITTGRSEPSGTLYIQYTTTNGQHRTASYFRILSVQAPRLHGADVQEVQRRLLQVLPAARGLKIDGYYGPATAAAVKKYQIGNDLTPNGVVNFDVWAVLFNVGE